ncbi:MAG: antibiotic biosynthesis monooxygenase [Bauldia sp.]|nr:antibiotic biosynthesis monooxygenase [Bauldia sp.]
MIIVTGHMQLAPEVLEALRPAARKTIEATRAEKGCILYSWAEDLVQPGLLRIVERWEDWASLEAHGKAPHMNAWRALLAEVEIIDREVIGHEAGEERGL